MRVIDKLNAAVNCHQNGKLKEAESIYYEVLKLDPNNVDTLYLLGVICHQQEKFDNAVNFLKRAISLKPRFEMYKVLGDVYLDINQIDNAVFAYEKALEFDSEFSEGHYNLGFLYFKSGNFDKAIEHYNKFLQINPDAPEVYNNLASIYSSRSQLDLAADCYLKSILFDPDNSDVYFNLGNLYKSAARFDKATEYLQKSIKLNPRDGEAYFHLGLNYFFNKQYDEAHNTFIEALNLKYHPDKIYSNIGNIYFEKCDFEQALANYNKAISLNPNVSTAYNNIGIIYKFKNDLKTAIDYYKKALRSEPNDLQIKYNIARAYIADRKFEEGWKYFVVRDEMYDNFNKGQESLLNKDWKDNIEGKTIYVNHTGGYGDAVLFSRYLPLLHQKGAKIIAKPPKAVAELLKNNDLKAEFLDYSIPDNQINYDARICSMCLPCYFKSNFETIPCKEAYLKPDIEKVKSYKEKYFTNNDFKIGIVWNTGTKSDKEYDNRTMLLESFYGLGKIDGIKIYSLQKGTGIEELDNLSPDMEIVSLGEAFEDFSETAAAIENLDLIIGADTSVTNLAGAMGKKTWILIPYMPDWRWFLDIEYTPWYESVRLFRQNEPGNWQEVMDRVIRELNNTI